MKNVTFIIWAFVVLCAGCSSSTSVVQDEVSMTKKQLADKVKGGWAAKTIGCTYGGPVEFLHNGTMIQDYTPIKWSICECVRPFGFRGTGRFFCCFVC